MIAGESLVELTDIPASDTGAPCPVVYANEQSVLAAYYLTPSATYEGKSGVVIFERVSSCLFGGPNDEALQGHRLARIGLQPYSFFEVNNSAWIADLCARNRVHPYHQDLSYADLRHFIFTFHDSTLEVAARGYNSQIETGDPIDCISRRLRDKQLWS